LRDEVTNVLTSGLAGGCDRNIVLWNASLGRKLFEDERAELRLAGTDALDQNRGTTRTVTSTCLQDARNETPGEYVMLAFTHTFKQTRRAGHQASVRTDGLDSWSMPRNCRTASFLRTQEKPAIQATPPARGRTPLAHSRASAIICS
jgi:hypothetical protein